RGRGAADQRGPGLRRHRDRRPGRAVAAAGRTIRRGRDRVSPGDVAGSAHGGDEERVRLLSAVPPAPARMVLDTDAWNEIDDQFALVHVLLAPDRVRLEAGCEARFSP